MRSWPYPLLCTCSDMAIKPLTRTFLFWVQIPTASTMLNRTRLSHARDAPIIFPFRISVQAFKTHHNVFERNATLVCVSGIYLPFEFVANYVVRFDLKLQANDPRSRFSDVFQHIARWNVTYNSLSNLELCFLWPSSKGRQSTTAFSGTEWLFDVRARFSWWEPL